MMQMVDSWIIFYIIFLGKVCGQSPGYEKHKYLYFWLPMPGQFHKATCVTECKIFSEVEADRSDIVKKYYADTLTGAPPSSSDYRVCIFQRKINRTRFLVRKTLQ